MNVLRTLEPLLENLSEQRLGQLIDFARFLAAEEERGEWQRFGLSQLANAYGPDEPDYSERDRMPKPRT